MSQLNLTQVERGAEAEQMSDEFGPVIGTLSTGRIAMIWLAANLVVTTLLTGTLFVPGLSWLHSIELIITGTLVGASILVLVGNIGTRTGLSTMSLTKGAFGLRGSYVTAIANVVILMGWSWVQAILAGITVDYMVEQLTGFSNPVLFSVLCQLVVVGLAIFGHAGIAKVEPWLALIILSIMGYVFSVVFSDYSVAELTAIKDDPALGWNTMLVLDVVIATAISWTVLSAEFNRLAKSQKAGVIGSGIGYCLSTILSMTLGATAIGYVALKGLDVNGFDPITIVSAFGFPLAIAIFLSVIATNTMVVYGMVSSILNLSPVKKLRFLPTALIVGAISVVGASWLSMLDKFTHFLTLIGALFVPVFAIMIVDYYLLNRSDYHKDILRGSGGRYWYCNGFNWMAFTVWIAGFLLSFGLSGTAGQLGVTIPVFVFAFLAYWSGMTLLTRKEPTVAVE